MVYSTLTVAPFDGAGEITIVDESDRVYGFVTPSTVKLIIDKI